MNRPVQTHRLLTRLAVDKIFHPFQPFILGQKCFAPKMAIKFNIPLIFYGEQEAEYGTPVNEAMSSKRDWTFSAISERDNMFFGGIAYNSLKQDFGYSPRNPRQPATATYQVSWTAAWDHPTTRAGGQDDVS